TAAAPARMAAVTAPASIRAAGRLPVAVAEIEDVFIDRPLHSLFVVLLPHLGPRPAEHVGDLVLEGGSRGQRRRLAVDGEDCLDALDVSVTIARVRAAQFVE